MTWINWTMVHKNCVQSIEVLRNLLRWFAWFSNRAFLAWSLWKNKAFGALKEPVEIKCLLKFAHWVDLFVLPVLADAESVNVYLEYWRKRLDAKKFLSVLKTMLLSCIVLVDPTKIFSLKKLSYCIFKCSWFLHVDLNRWKSLTIYTFIIYVCALDNTLSLTVKQSFKFSLRLGPLHCRFQDVNQLKLEFACILLYITLLAVPSKCVKELKCTDRLMIFWLLLQIEKYSL